MEEKYDVFGVGNALMDIQAFVDDEFLANFGLHKGIMHLIDEDTSRKILESLSPYKLTSVPGGSCANTISAIAKLGGKVSFTGIVTDDFYGRLYNTKLVQRGIKSLIKFRKYGLTGTSIVLTTEDAERTMNTHLGVCRDLSIDDIDFSILCNSKVFHFTGYIWDVPQQIETINYILNNIEKLDITISFDLADPFCVSKNKNEFKSLIEKHIDIIFGNMDEIKMLTDIYDPVSAGKELIEMGAKIVLIKVGKEGSFLFYGKDCEKIPVYQPEKVLDTTGCGDVYAGGFLFGYTKGYDLIKSAHIASFYASRIVAIPGVQFELLNYEQIKNFINNNILKI